MKKSTLPRRIEASILLVSVFFLVLLVGVYYVKERLEDELFARQTRAEIDYLRALLEREPGARLPRTAGLTAFLDSRRSTQPIPEYLASLDVGSYHDIRIGERAYHVIVERLAEDRVYLRFDVTEIEQLEQLLDLGLAGAAVLLLISILATARILGRRLSAPVAELSTMLTKINPDERGLRIGDRFDDDEIGRIARAFDQYLEKMDDYVEKQMAFAAMASHELRSPLTIVQTSAELIASRHDDPEIRAHLERIRRASENLSNLVHALLAVTRDLPSANLQNLALRKLVDEIVENMAVDIRRRRIRIDNRVPGEARVDADPELLGVVLSNLLRNSARHGQDSDIVISVHGNSLEISDNGLGLETVDLERLFDFAVRGGRSQGYGVGLYITKLICDHQGWALTLAANPGGGVVARVDLGGPVNTPLTR